MAKRPTRKKTDKRLPNPEEVEKATSEITSSDEDKRRVGRPKADHSLERFSSFMAADQKEALKLIATLEKRKAYEILSEAMEAMINEYRAKYPNLPL